MQPQFDPRLVRGIHHPLRRQSRISWAVIVLAALTIAVALWVMWRYPI